LLFSLEEYLYHTLRAKVNPVLTTFLKMSIFAYLAKNWQKIKLQITKYKLQTNYKSQCPKLQMVGAKNFSPLRDKRHHFVLLAEGV